MLFQLLIKMQVCQVHTDVIKLGILNSKIIADFLVAMKTNLEIKMNMQPMVMKYTST